jgi:hypothetical protein
MCYTRGVQQEAGIQAAHKIPESQEKLMSDKTLSKHINGRHRSLFSVCSISLLVGGLLFARPAHANLLTNGSFESPVENGVAIFGTGSAGIADWTVIGPAGSNIALQSNSVTAAVQAEDGSQYLDLTGTLDGQSIYGGVQQTIATVANTTYALTFFGGNYSFNSAAFDSGQTGLEAIAGAAQQTFTVPAVTSGYTWDKFTMSFTATGASTTISILGTAGDLFTGLDNVSVVQTSSAAPEPATWALFAVPLGALAVKRLRRA